MKCVRAAVMLLGMGGALGAQTAPGLVLPPSLGYAPGNPTPEPSPLLTPFNPWKLEPLPMDRSLAGSPGAELQEALTLAREGQLSPARAKAEAFLKENPSSAPAEEILGLVLVLQGETDAGLSHLLRAVELDPRQYTAVTKVGDVYMARGDFGRARAQFLQAAQLNPLDRFPHQRLGIIFEQEGDYALAIEHYEKGLVGAPAEYVGTKVNLGRVYNLTHQFRRTIALLEGIATEGCTDPIAHLVLGTALLLSGQTKDALVSFERVEKREKRPEVAQLALGIAYRDAGDLGASRQKLEAAVAAKPDWSAAHFQLGETLAALGRSDDAVAHYRHVPASEAASWVLAQNRIGEVYSSHGAPDQAIAAYQAARKSGKANVRTYEGLAAILQSREQFSEAENVLREADQAFPGNPRVKFRLGMQRALVRDYEGALSALSTARDLAPNDPRILKAISMTELRRNNLPAATAAARRLLEVAPRSGEDQFYLATLLEQSGREDAEAALLYEKLLAAQPNHLGALNNLALLRLKQKKISAALALTQKARELAPENPVVLDTLGWVQCAAGDLAGAEGSLGKAIAAGSESPTHRYHLAVVYAKLGRNEKALALLDQALGPMPEFSERAEALRLAEQLRTHRAR